MPFLEKFDANLQCTSEGSVGQLLASLLSLPLRPTYRYPNTYRYKGNCLHLLVSQHIYVKDASHVLGTTVT